MTKPRIKKVKAPVVQKSKIIEIIAERLSSIETVPPEEQGKMVMRACRAARDYEEELENKIKVLDKALAIAVETRVVISQMTNFGHSDRSIEDLKKICIEAAIKELKEESE